MHSINVTQEIKDYYKKKFHFDDVDFVAPGSFGSVEPEDQTGKIILTRNGVTETITVNDILWQQGFDAINDMLGFADTQWGTVEFKKVVSNGKVYVNNNRDQ